LAERGAADTTSFKELERQGWGAKADDYDTFAGQITVGAVAPLLDAAGVGAGMRVLDIACGPGYVAAGATARGAHAIGMDFAANMVAEARRRYPTTEFREGDAENLTFDAASFDAVVCAFGLLHIADPDKAIAEAYRVLRPDGRYAFAVWMGPDRHDFFAIVLKALEAHGNMQVSLPPAPPIFRFSDPAECQKALTQAGFVDASVIELALNWRAPSRQSSTSFTRARCAHRWCLSAKHPTRANASIGQSTKAPSALRTAGRMRSRGRPRSRWRASQIGAAPEPRRDSNPLFQSASVQASSPRACLRTGDRHDSSTMPLTMSMARRSSVIEASSVRKPAWAVMVTLSMAASG
jgi:SAM-dependent methyltransferase